MSNLLHTDSVIAAAEVWVKTTNELQWQLVEACYGNHQQLNNKISIRYANSDIFQSVTEARRPLLIANIQAECAERGIEAPVDLSVILALPTFERGNVTSALLLFFSFSNNSKGAVELWSGREGTHELSMVDGHYACLEQFGHISKFVHLPYGSGLPGLAWKFGSAQLMSNIHLAQSFLRSSSADSDGLDTGIAFPVIDYHMITGIVTLLSSKENPICRACEIWKPNVVENSPALVKINAQYGDCTNLENVSTRLSLQPGEGLIGKIWELRRPIVVNDLSSVDFMRRDAAVADDLHYAVGIPSMLGEVVNSILVIFW